MNFPKTAEDIKNEIIISSDKSGDLRLRQLIHILQKLDNELIIEGVIQVIENDDRPDTCFRYQEFAGQMLEKLKPKSQKDIKEILQRTLKNWNKSVEQFPFWLHDNYGIDKLKAAFEQMSFSEIEKNKIETIKWWLQISNT